MKTREPHQESVTYKLLVMLREHSGDLRVRDIARNFHTTPANIGTPIRRLLERGLVQKIGEGRYIERGKRMTEDNKLDSLAYDIFASAMIKAGNRENPYGRWRAMDENHKEQWLQIARLAREAGESVK